MQLWRFVSLCTGITATLICFPLDVLRTRLMAPWAHKYGGPLTTLKCMVKYEGPGALYAGGDNPGPAPRDYCQVLSPPVMCFDDQSSAQLQLGARKQLAILA